MTKETISINDWSEYLKQQDIPSELREKLIAYVSTLLSKDVPVIFEIDHLSKLLSIDPGTLRSIITYSKAFYRVFEIPKRSGGVRSISAPYPVLSSAQTWIKENILCKVPVHDSVHGFCKNRSVITNAQAHLKHKAVLKIDILNYFPSIKINRIVYIFQKLGYSDKVSYFLAKLCTLDDQLPQGAPTSPDLSNIVGLKFDKRLQNLATAWHMTYTRYADDLTFSAKYIPSGFINIVSKVLIEEGFFVNEKKTKLITGSGRKIITGISVADGKLKLPKSTKRKLRQIGYHLSKDNFINLESITKDPFYLERIIGSFNFWLQVEPENKFAHFINEKLKYLSRIKL